MVRMKPTKSRLESEILETTDENGIVFKEDHLWWKNEHPVWCACVGGNSEKGVVVLKDSSKNSDGSHDFHVVGSPKKEILDCIMCLTDNLPSNVNRISSHGGITPGGIHAILRLKDYGWTLVGTESGEDKGHYWAGTTNVDLLKKWMSNPDNKDYWEETGKNTGNILKDTGPKVPIMELK